MIKMLNKAICGTFTSLYFASIITARNPFYFTPHSLKDIDIECLAIGKIVPSNEKFALVNINQSKYKVVSGSIVDNYKIIIIEDKAIIVQDDKHNEFQISLEREPFNLK